jgi:nicotinate-nucleotide adenylyltransferase
MTTSIEELAAILPPLRGMGRVGLLGGSFNPPHLGHLLMVMAVLATEEIDQLWIVPCADHAFGKHLLPFDDRVRMCHLAFRHLGGGAVILDVERRLPAPNYTVQLLRALHAARPGIRPVWIAGSDILADLHKWREPEALPSLCRMVIVPRRGYDGGTRLQIDLPLLSSTDVRERMMAGEDVSGMVDREVIAYLERRGLFQPTPSAG